MLLFVAAGLAQETDQDWVRVEVLRSNGKVLASARYERQDWASGVPWTFVHRGEGYVILGEGARLCLYHSGPAVAGVPSVGLSCVDGPAEDLRVPDTDRLTWRVIDE
jgi:hypothetical protein